MILYKQFSVNGADYFYDTATNAIVRLPWGVSPWLDELVAADATPESTDENNSEWQVAASFVERAQSRSGLLVSRPVRDYRGILDGDSIRRLLDHGMRGLLLGVTDGCNQRCSYCIYSGNYAGKRTHGANRMSWDVARRSIDMFVAHHADSAPVFFTFYGGEPLVAWGLVRRCVEYIKRLDLPESTIVVNTNLTLLDEAKAAFLTENDVGLAVSLDGPASIHDAARRFPSGKPTHARVVYWLRYLHDHYPVYWRDKVVLQATFDKNLDLEAVFDYFCDETWCDLPNSITGIHLEGQSDYSYDDEAKERHGAALERLISRHLRALESGELFAHRLFANLFQQVCKDIAERQIGYAPAEARPMKTCVPGVARLYVDPQGAFYPCERTDVAGARIGDIEHGIDPARVRLLLTRQVQFCETECVRCWASRLCSLCLTHFLDRGQIRRQAARRRCDEQRERILRALERFTHIYNNEPRATWDHPFSLHHRVAEAQRKGSATI